MRDKDPNSARMVFDLEGTLVDLEKLHQQAFENVAEKLGLEFGPAEFHAFVGAGDAAIAKEIARLGKLIQYELDPGEIRKAKNKIYEDLLNAHTIAPREGVPEYLEKAKTLVGGDLVVASITPDELAKKIIDEARLMPFFKHVLTEFSVTKRKPDPEVYKLAAAMVGADNKDLVVNEDSPTGVKAAKSAGSPVAAFPVHKNLVFEPAPDVIFLSWKNVDPREVVELLLSRKK